MVLCSCLTESLELRHAVRVLYPGVALAPFIPRCIERGRILMESRVCVEVVSTREREGGKGGYTLLIRKKKNTTNANYKENKLEKPKVKS